jgi:uncharacterized protein YkwD
MLTITRLRTLLAVAAAVLVASWGVAAYVAPHARAITLNTAERRVLHLINASRKRHGLHTVRLRSSLYHAAKAHSRSMIGKDYFSHYSYSGATPAERILSYGYTQTGCTYWKVGECIGWGKDDVGTARAIFHKWMKSSGHRAIILTKAWRDVGVGRATGTFEGLSGVRMFTIDFGRRKT